MLQCRCNFDFLCCSLYLISHTTVVGNNNNLLLFVQYFLRRVWCTGMREANNAFTQEMVNYVDEVVVYVHRDIYYLLEELWMRCAIRDHCSFKDFYAFSEKDRSTSLHYKWYGGSCAKLSQISCLQPMWHGTGKIMVIIHREMKSCLQDANEKIEARLTEYAGKILRAFVVVRISNESFTI